VTGFKGRSGKSFRARLALAQSEDGKWRVEFDEPWAGTAGEAGGQGPGTAGGVAGPPEAEEQGPSEEQPEAA
jgi:DNA topoisomerase-3